MAARADAQARTLSGRAQLFGQARVARDTEASKFCVIKLVYRWIPAPCYCHGDQATGLRNCVLKLCTIGATFAMAARHSGASRAATRAFMHAVASGYRHSSVTLFSMLQGTRKQ